MDDTLSVECSVALVQIRVCIPAAIRQLHFFLSLLSLSDRSAYTQTTYSLPPNLAALAQEDH